MEASEQLNTGKNAEEDEEIIELVNIVQISPEEYEMPAPSSLGEEASGKAEDELTDHLGMDLTAETAAPEGRWQQDRELQDILEPETTARPFAHEQAPEQPWGTENLGEGLGGPRQGLDPGRIEQIVAEEVRKIVADRIDDILAQAVEEAVSREIRRLKQALKD